MYQASSWPVVSATADSNDQLDTENSCDMRAQSIIKDTCAYYILKNQRSFTYSWT